MPAILADFRSALVTFRRSPSFAAAIVLTLALGIAPNCVVFAIMDAVYFRPLPYPGQERLALLNVSHPSKATLDGVDAFTFTEWQRRATGFERSAAYRNAAISLNWNDQPERIPGQVVSVDFFDVLGMRPRLGRAFERSDALAGAARALVISHRTWQDYFSGRADVVGLELRVDGTPATVIGVMPPDFVSFMEGRPARAWMAMSVTPGSSPAPETLGNAVARLKPGVALASARATLEAAHATLAREHPDFYRDRAVSLRDFRSSLFGGLGPGIRMLTVLVGLVLFIACGNAANLLLGRSLQRRREVAVRTALGARRPQLFRGLLVESLALAVAGAAVGIIAAYWAVALVWARSGPIFQIIGVDGLPFDHRVLAFAALLAAGVAVLFGVLPALRESGVDLVEALRDGTAGAGRGGRRQRMSRILVVAQVSLCVVTLIVATLVLRSVAHFASLASNPGFRPGALLVATLPAPAGVQAPAPRLAALEEIRRHVAAVAGVDGVALTDGVPFLDGGKTTEASLAGGDGGAAQAGQRFDAERHLVTPGFFALMSMPIARGRPLSSADTVESVPVVVISDRLATARWQGRDPLGDRLWVEGAWRTVVGVVASSAATTPFRQPPGELFLPLTQSVPADVKLLVRSRRAVAQLGSSIRREVRAVDRDQPVAELRTMEEALDRFMTPFRLILGLTLAFAAIAVSLAAVGLYAVIAQSVSRRTREMGVRMALGAGRAEVVRLVLGEGLRLALVGLAIGLLPGLAIVRILPSALFGIGGLSPFHFAAATVIWLVVALAACLPPARRAGRVPPMAALRCE